MISIQTAARLLIFWRNLMDDEYKKQLTHNLYMYVFSNEYVNSINPCKKKGLKKLLEHIWLEATRQADERNSVK